MCQRDAILLGELAETLMRVRDVKFNTGEKLAEIIASSVILPAETMPHDCVGLGSDVTYRPIGERETATIAIAVPEQASRALSRVSILAPIAMALIGMKVNSVVEVELPFSQVMFVELLSVRQASGVGSGVAAAAPTKKAV